MSIGVVPALAVVPVPGPAPTFNPPVSYNAGGGATMPVQADFNQDGIMDIAVTNPVTGTVNILLGPTFAFNAFLSYPSVPGNVLAQPVYLGVGDFNKDGKPDLVVVNKQDNSATVLKNTLSGGTLSFATTVIPIPLPSGATGIQPVQVAVGDVDGDGNLDFVTANYLSNSITVFFGTGNAANFTARAPKNYILPPACPGASNPNSIVLADLNRDGKLDAVAGANNCSQLFVLVNTGSTGSSDPYAANATFANPMSYTIGANCVAEGVADMNGDLSPDVVVSNNGGVGGTAVISILFGNGDGFLGTAPCSAGCGKGTRLDITGVGQSPQGVVLGDVNGDSYTDIVVVDDAHSATDGVKIFLGNGLGCFGVPASPAPTCGTWAPVTLVPGTLPRGIGMGDVTGDGKPDLYVANTVGPGVTLFENTLPGARACAATLSPPNCITPRTPCVGMDVRIDNVLLPAGATVRGYSLTLKLSSNLNLCASPAGGTPPVAAFVKGEYLQGSPATRTTIQQVTQNPDGSYTIDEAVLTPPPGAGCGAPDLSGRLFTVFLSSPPGTVGTGTVTVTGLTLRDCNNGAITAFPCPAASQGTISIKMIRPDSPTALVVRQQHQLPFPLANPPGQTTGIVVNWTLPSVDQTSPMTLDVWRAPFTSGTGACAFLNGYPDYQGAAPTTPDLISPTVGNFYPLSSAVTFDRKPDISVLNGPVAVAIANLHQGPCPIANPRCPRDCILDLVTANGGSPNISELPGAGSGAFPTKTDIPVGAGPASVAVGDINVDGWPDIAVANSGSGNVTVLLGGPSGFMPANGSPFAVGTNPISVAMGDLNGDSKLDLVVANNGSGNVSVLLANLSGTLPLYAAAVPYAVGASPTAVAMADLNGDGKLDLIVTLTGSTNNLMVLLGRGDGAFTLPAIPFTVGTNPTSVAVGYVDSDTLLDVVTANNLPGPNGSVSVLYGTGAPSLLGNKNDFTVGGGPRSVAIADVNGDGWLDILTANSTGNTVSVLPGTGTQGAFGSRVDFPVANGPVSIAVGDVNGDGKLDVVTATPSPAPSLSVLWGTSPSTLPWVRVARIAPGAATRDHFYDHKLVPFVGPGPLRQRGFWYYCVVRVDECGTPSTPLGPTPSDVLSNGPTSDGGTLNYHLGDVTTTDIGSKFPPPYPIGIGDNRVNGLEDYLRSGLANAYGMTSTIPLGDPKGCWDMGPTSIGNLSTPNYMHRRPTRDVQITTDDIFVLAANVGLVNAPQDAVVPAAADHDELSIEAPERVANGDAFEAKIRLKGAGDLRGISLALAWDPVTVEPVSVGSGELADAQQAWVLSNGPGHVFAVVLGGERAGFVGDGVVAVVKFRAKAGGGPGLRFKEVDARNMGLERVFVAGADQPPPAVTGLGLTMPNPFNRSTTLSFTLSVEGRAELAIYSVDGRRVKTLANGTRPSGAYRIEWNGTDDAGHTVAPGLFFARLLTAHGRATQVLVKIR
jgi:hypothetical protein